jgi:hypothetical protein
MFLFEKNNRSKGVGKLAFQRLRDYFASRSLEFAKRIWRPAPVLAKPKPNPQMHLGKMFMFEKICISYLSQFEKLISKQQLIEHIHNS